MSGNNNKYGTSDKGNGQQASSPGSSSSSSSNKYSSGSGVSGVGGGGVGGNVSTMNLHKPPPNTGGYVFGVGRDPVQKMTSISWSEYSKSKVMNNSIRIYETEKKILYRHNDHVKEYYEKKQ